jgi:hypothetical protein
MGELLESHPTTRGLVALMVGWSLLTDTGDIKRAGVPILRSLNIRYRLKQQARERRIGDVSDVKSWSRTKEYV